MILVDETKLQTVLTILEVDSNGRYWEMLDILRSMLKKTPINDQSLPEHCDNQTE